MTVEAASATPRPEPPRSTLTQPFWDATRNGEYLLQWCDTCGKPIFFPREICPGCLDEELSWRPASGRGTVYAVTIEHRPQDPRLADRAPLAVALIDLAEGVRVMSNVVGCPPDTVQPGMAVRITWEQLADGFQLPVFTPENS